jgi:hypothetical protein
MTEPKRTYRQGLQEGRLQGIKLVTDQLHEYRVLVTAVSEREKLKADEKARLLGGVAAIDSMLEIADGIVKGLEKQNG